MHMGHKVNNPTSSLLAQLLHKRILFPLQLLFHPARLHKRWGRLNCFQIATAFHQQTATWHLPTILRDAASWTILLQKPNQSAHSPHSRSICRHKIHTRPLLVGDAGSKGRWIYTAEFIRKGMLAQDTSRDNVGAFKDAEMWRRYTYTLGEADAEAACNFMEGIRKRAM